MMGCDLRRRRFLQATAGFGAAALAGAVGYQRYRRRQPAANHSPPKPLSEVVRHGWALGSDVAITALHTDRERAEQALAGAFEKLDAIEDLMSIYRPQSQLSRLNRVGHLSDPHPMLVQVVRAAQQMSRRSNGAFDITVQPLWQAYRDADRSGRLPTADELQAAQRQVDWTKVQVSDREIRLSAPVSSITLNGIAQGFAVDATMQHLAEHGVEHALIDTGELGALGRHAEQRPWRSGIQHPHHPDAYIALAELDGRCLATSGDYETTFGPQQQQHHLLDPDTGRSPRQLSSVTVCAPLAMTADALSTAAFVLGPERGLELVAKTPDADMLLVDKNGRARATAGFPGEWS